MRLVQKPGRLVWHICSPITSSNWNNRYRQLCFSTSVISIRYATLGPHFQGRPAKKYQVCKTCLKLYNQQKIKNWASHGQKVPSP